jgi:hypothetical protein
MTVTRAVLDDLLPLYIAGEVSPDTQRLVEEYLAQDPTLANAIESARGVRLPPVEAPPDLERRALENTRRLLGRRSWLASLSLVLSFAPLWYTFEKGQVTFLLFRDAPWLAVLLLAAAAFSWVRFFLVCRRLQATGMQPRRGNKARGLWLLTAYLVGYPYAVVIYSLTGWSSSLLHLLQPVFMLITLVAGERLGQIGIAEPIRPTTLFGPRPED